MSGGSCDLYSLIAITLKNPNNQPAVIINFDIVVGSKHASRTVVQLLPEGKDATSRVQFVSDRVKRAMSNAFDLIGSELAVSP